MMRNRSSGKALLAVLNFLTCAPLAACSLSASVWLALPQRAKAQIVVIDDVILLTSRQKKQEEARRHQHLDPPGGEILMAPSPGGDEPRLGEEALFPSVLPRLLSRKGKRRGQRGKETRLHPGTAGEPQTEESTFEGPLELTAELEGPPGALSLPAAVEQLVAANPDLAARFQDISKARADILTAGLRSNPFLFLSISNIPYGHFSPQQPASTSYDLTVIQPLDLNGKRGFRLRAAQEARDVVETQYQDAVRQKIARLHDAFVDVLQARQEVQAQRAGLARLALLEETIRRRDGQGRATESDTLTLERSGAEMTMERSEATLLQAQRELALLLSIPSEQSSSLALLGSLHDRAAAPPCLEELIALALQTRPDLAAYRLGLRRAQAAFRRERAEAIDNVFLFFTPFTANDYSPLGKQSASGCGLGVLLPVPLFDRNQGEIARAGVNVEQTRSEQQGLERRIVNEVQYAATEYAVSRNAVRQYESEMLAAARALRDEQTRLFANGQATLESVLEVQKEYDEVVRDYLGMLVYHRRTMLRLNIAVGQCLLP